MAPSITESPTKVTGSSLTTIAGFLVLCTMNLTLGKDLGLVMAKGVFLGVISVLTIFPSLILISDKLINKTKHKPFTIHFEKLNKFVIKHHVGIFILFIILIIFYIFYFNFSANSKTSFGKSKFCPLFFINICRFSIVLA